MTDQTRIQTRQRAHTEPFLHILDVVQIILRNWVWFAFSILTCIILGYIHSERTTLVYKANAAILIVEREHTNTESSMFSDLGINNVTTSIENEIAILGSSNLMLDVVSKLGINTTYIVKQSLRYIDIYGVSPIEIEWLNIKHLSHFSVNIQVTSIDEKRYRINNIESRIGDTVKIANAKFIVKATKHWGGHFSKGPIDVNYTNEESYANSIISRLSVQQQNPDVSTVLLSLTDSNSKRAKDILNTLIGTYNETVAKNKIKINESVEKIVNERINLVRQDLASVDEELEKFKRENGILDFAQNNRASLFQNISDHKDRALDFAVQTLLIESAKSIITSSSFENIPQNKVFKDMGIGVEIDIYNNKIIELNQTKKHSGDKNPIVIKMKNQLNVLKVNLKEAIDKVLTSLELEKNELLKQEGVLDNQISSIPQHEKIIKNIEREQGLKEDIYIYLLDKRETNALNEAIVDLGAKIIEKAKGSNFPIEPKTTIILMASAVLGFLIPSAILLLISLFNTKIQNKKDIEERTNIPILGIIPKMTKKKQRVLMGIIVGETGKDLTSEAFRLVHSNLTFISRNIEKQGDVIQVTSTASGDGKTRASINLALSCAYVNKKTIVVDMDLRRRGLSKLLDSCTNIGLSAYLAGAIKNIDDIITRSDQHSNLDYISAGSLPPNAVSLLMSEKFDVFMSELRKRYDYIILDSPPYFITADAQIINAKVDSTIYIIRSNRLNKNMLFDLDIMSHTNKIKNMSILLTDVDYKKSEYGYSSGYGYGYGYGENEID